MTLLTLLITLPQLDVKAKSVEFLTCGSKRRTGRRTPPVM
jgi:hypothetical protein